MTFTTPLGSFKWLWDSVIAVVDDFAIGTATVEEHMTKVIEVVCTLAEKGFSVKVEKMHLFVKEFIFLGHLSTETGLEATDHLIEAVKICQYRRLTRKIRRSNFARF